MEDMDGNNYIVQSSLTHFEANITTEKFSIKSVKTGTELYKISGVEHPVVKTNFLIVNPNQDVNVSIDSKSKVDGICYFFAPQLIQQIKFANSHSGKENLENLHPSEHLNFHNIPVHSFQTFLNPYIQYAPAFSEWTAVQISEFLISLAEEMVAYQINASKRLHQLEGIKKATKKELYKRIQSGRQYMHDCFQNPVSLKEISKAACLSEYYFHRSFRNYFNCTPYQYLHLLRMNRARHLFNTGQFSKKEIAIKCGYQDSKYFSKSYKKWLLHKA